MKTAKLAIITLGLILALGANPAFAQTDYSVYEEILKDYDDE